MQSKPSSQTANPPALVPIPISEVDQKLDVQFVHLLTKIESKYLIFNRHLQIRIEKWVEKLLNYDHNTVWRKIRNSYIGMLWTMVQRGKIQGVFLRMPPEKDIPNIGEWRHGGEEETAEDGNKEEQTTHEISIKKIEEPCGDAGSEIATPNCLTDRANGQDCPRQSKDLEVSEETGRGRDQTSQRSGNAHSIKSNRMGKKQVLKVIRLLSRHEQVLKQDEDFQPIMLGIDRLLVSSEQGQQQEQSAELRVEEGIQLNKANLFQFGSPRGMTQMQYFKAALQL